MRRVLSKIILALIDLFAILMSIVFAYGVRLLIGESLLDPLSHDIDVYLYFPFFYIVPLFIFFYEGLYTKRYDFWQESRKVIKALIVSSLLVFTILALTKEITGFSRIIIVLVFLFMALLVPLFKNIVKKQLYKSGLWQRKVRVYGCDVLVRQEVFNNPYLGYVDAKSDEAETVFINAKDTPFYERNILISMALATKKEVVFIPAMEEFDLTHSHIDILQNTRTNTIMFQNKLACPKRKIFQAILNYTLAVLSLPIILSLIGVFSVLIKKESSGPIFFTHNRVGKDGKIISIYKFRSMFSDAKERLEKLVSEDDDLRQEWEKNFKLKNDPRITKVGRFLRQTSLDELPQIFNILKGEMHFVGPRPVVKQEIAQYYKEDATYYYMVKPGITGLWQVSGRSDTDYDFRIKTDKWYVMNWSLWLDIVILFKTVKVVLFREGAY